MSQITSHILDTTKGKPAAGVAVILYQQQNNSWTEIAKSQTNNDGRVTDLVNKDVALPTGIYKIKFFTREYFSQLSVPAFYPFIEIVFELASAEHYHIPLLLNPFGYTTYRGS
jgi:5-hydroxyisourate hydrolase